MFEAAPRALVNETEASRILDLSVKTLRRWRWAGKPKKMTAQGHLAEIPTRLCFRQSVFTRPRPFADLSPVCVAA